MSEKTRQWLPWIAGTLVLAALVHMGSLYAVPRLVMMRALSRLGAPNTMHFGKRPDASSRGIVRPSPDLLYATCPFDLSAGPLRVTARVSHANYWSVSAFDDATDNFFVRNDQQIGSDTLEILLVRRGQSWPKLGDALERTILFSPTARGVILFRTVIDDEKRVPQLEALLHRSTCETVAPAKSLR